MDLNPDDVFGDRDPDDIFRDDEDDPDNELFQEGGTNKELLVYLVDASPKMFSTSVSSDDADDQTPESHFRVAVSCLLESLKTQIINRSYDEVSICFFNTREKKNLQDLNGVFVYNVAERDDLDRPTARLIKEFERIEENFSKDIGSKLGISSSSRDNALYNALWVAQALLRKGSVKTADKRMLLLTNEDDPFGNLKGVIKMDMMRTTMQRAKDAQDLGISIEVLPLGNEFNVSLFYADLLGLEGDEVNQFKVLVGERFEDMKNQLRKRIMKKRKIRRIKFVIGNGLEIEVDTYALIRPTNPGAITWLDSTSNLPLKTDRSFVCADTGALVEDFVNVKRFQPYKDENVMFSVDELSEIKRVSSNGHLRLLGFKPLSCLKDYHNIKPSTFIFPSDKEMLGSTNIFVCLHRSMLRLKRFAVAFFGSSSNPRLVALIAQEEIITSGGQIEPPGMHMIYLPYSDDIRPIEEANADANTEPPPRASDDQILKASVLVRKVDLKDFSVCQFANPAIQRHYAIVQALALDEDEMPEIKDETLPDEEGMNRPAIVKALQEFKVSVYGEHHDDEIEEKDATKGSRKRKEVGENAIKEYSKYDWNELADGGKLKDLTLVELKYYLIANNLPVTGVKQAVITRILTHMGK